MIRFLLTFALAAGLAVAAGSATTGARADDKKPDTGGFKPETVVLATTIDFGTELGLEFAGLKGLGARIEAARSAPDPVALAAAAIELGAAEKAAGKTAKLTSEALLKEALALAARRNSSAELTALSALVTDAAAKKDLAEKAAEAKKAERTAKRGVRGSVTVLNNSERVLAIYVNGQYVGNVKSNNEASFFVGDDGPDTELLARSGKYKWGPRIVSNDVKGYRWTLNPLNE